MNENKTSQQSIHEGIEAYNREHREREKREFFAWALPRLLARLGETDKLLGQAGGDRPEVARQQARNRDAIAAAGADAEGLLARLRESDKLLWKIRPADRRSRLRLAILGQCQRNESLIEY